VNGGKQRENISHLFTQLVDELGLNADVTDKRHKIVFHTLRHTFASWMAIDGVDIYRIKELMRHKTISMTMRYAKLSPDANRSAVEGLSLRNAPKAGQLLNLADAKAANSPLD
ncbi:MAG: tyrosine-type recombinase/integrase, partial [Halodesulfovibrio sp.]